MALETIAILLVAAGFGAMSADLIGWGGLAVSGFIVLAGVAASVYQHTPRKPPPT